MGSIKREVEEFLNRVDKRGGIPYDLYIAILNENRTEVAGAPPPSLVLEHFCL